MAFVIPSIYQAVDRSSAVMGRIAAASSQMANSIAASSARASKSLNNITGGVVGEGVSEKIESLTDVSKVLAVFGGVAASVQSIIDYEDSLASFRTIVSDLNDVQFDKFKRQIESVASTTRRSNADVAASFEKIAGLNASFAQTAEGLGMVSNAAITLAKASRMELGTAAENLVGIMNQFSLSAGEANRTINALAAGQAVGAASITQTADALANFGAQAKGANITLEQSVALIQTMAAYGQQGSDAGTRLRSAIIKLQEAGVGYTTGAFNISEALATLKQRLDALPSAMAKDAYLTKTFGLEQITTGRILLDNVEMFKQFTGQVTGTNEALRAAEINSRTLSTRIRELGDRWANYLTTSSAVEMALAAVTNVSGLLINNLDAIVAIATPVLAFFTAYKVYAMYAAVRIAFLTKTSYALSFAQGILAAATGTVTGSLLENAAAARAVELSYNFMKLGMLGSLVVLGWVGVAVGALTALFFRHKLTLEDLQPVNEKTAEGFVKVDRAITQAEANLALYNDRVREYNKNQLDLEKFRAIQRYHERQGTTGSWAQFFDELPYFNVRSDMKAPVLEDFGLNESDARNITSSTNSSTDVNHHFTIDLKQGNNVVGSYSSKNMSPTVSSTTTP